MTTTTNTNLTANQAMYLKRHAEYARKYGVVLGLQIYSGVYGDAGVEALRVSGKLDKILSSPRYIAAEVAALAQAAEWAARTR